MYFQYDNKGVPLGFVLNGTQYFYITNQMGDVVAITESNGDIIGEYVYDEWGYILSENTMDPDTDPEPVKAVEMNPLRYRGYCYDRETGYYYLQSRYYDPSICRFINADIPEIAHMSKDISSGTNLFAYCNNEPVNNSDPTGNSSIKFIGVGIQIGISLGRIFAGIEYIFYKIGNKWKTTLFGFVGGSSNFNNVKKACNMILNKISLIKKGFSLNKLSKLPSLSISFFVILGNKNANISNYTGWFTNYGITYRHASLSVAISRTKRISIASVGIGATTQRYGFNFAQTMYFRYDSQRKNFNVLSTLKNNIYNKVAWIKFAGALIL